MRIDREREGGGCGSRWKGVGGKIRTREGGLLVYYSTKYFGLENVSEADGSRRPREARTVG